MGKGIPQPDEEPPEPRDSRSLYPGWRTRRRTVRRGSFWMLGVDCLILPFLCGSEQFVEQSLSNLFSVNDVPHCDFGECCSRPVVTTTVSADLRAYRSLPSSCSKSKIQIGTQKPGIMI